jgi:hypothetical protein
MEASGGLTMNAQTKQQLASKRIERDINRFLTKGKKIQKLAHDEFAVKYPTANKRERTK